MEKQPAVYIMANFRNGADYVGVTSNLMQRVHQHRNGLIPGFTKKYGIKRLIWYEIHETMNVAISREKQIKNWKRKWKLALFEGNNPQWRDLAEDLGFDPLE